MALRDSARLCGPRRGARRFGMVARRRRADGRSFMPARSPPHLRDAAVEAQAWSLLRRYGVVCRRLLSRETNACPWRELIRVYRRLEARGEIRGGRFVSGMSGEQFALVDAVSRLREIRRTPADGRLLVIGAVDPLNLAGIVTAGERVRAVASSRVVYRDGVPIAALEGECVRTLTGREPLPADLARVLTGRPRPALSGGFIGRAG